MSALADAIEGLAVDPRRMRQNLEATGGTIYAERAVMLLAPALGRDQAQRLVTEAVEESRRSGAAFARRCCGATLGRRCPRRLLADIDRPETTSAQPRRCGRWLLNETEE